MPRDANGVYTLPPSYFVQTGDTILPNQHNPPFEDVASALTNSIDRDGRTVMTGNLQMGGNKVTGLGDPSLPGDAMTRRVSGIEFETRSHAEAWAGTPSMPDSIVIRGSLNPQNYRRVDGQPPAGFQTANGTWYELVTQTPRVDTITQEFTLQTRLEVIQARMAAGEVVNIACYGDSTTDGSGTTGRTPNPTDGNGDAIGNSDHNLTAPNAWPAVLQGLLREMHGNPNINTWNAGYSARRLVDGWAYRNYERAIINNPYYGSPDITFIAFGLNDQLEPGVQIDAVISETVRLCKKVMSYGGIPVIVTCDITGRNVGGRINSEVTRQIDATRVALASELSIPIIDMAAHLEKWVGKNKDGFRWVGVQSDILHFGNDGHKYKAGIIARYLFRDILEVTDKIYLGSFSSKAQGGRNGVGGSSAANVRQGLNSEYLNITLPAGTRLMDAWVWTELEDVALVYRGIENEGIDEAGLIAGGNRVEVHSLLTGTTSKVIATSGLRNAANGYRKSDLPLIHGFLPFGLSRVSLVVGSGHTSGYFGSLDFIPMDRGPRNALKNCGIYTRTWIAPSGRIIDFLPEYSDGSNIWGVFGEESQDILLDVKLPKGCGVIFAHSLGWGRWDNTDQDMSATMLYRSEGGDILRPYHVRQSHAQETPLAYTPAGPSVPVSNVDDHKFRVRVFRQGDNQRLQVFDGWYSTTLIIDVTITRDDFPVHFGGAVGGFFVNGTAAGARVDCELRSAIIL